jgi:hypothetical protein
LLEDPVFFGTQTASLGSAISQPDPEIFQADQVGWYSVTYDLAFNEQPYGGTASVTLHVTGGTTSGADVPFSPQEDAVTNVSDTQLVDCTTTDCQFSLQMAQFGPPIIQLQYGDITITQVNTSS